MHQRPLPAKAVNVVDAKPLHSINKKMTEQEIEILSKYSNYEIPFEDLKPEIKFDKLQDLEYVSSYIEEALKSNNENLTKAACAIYFYFNDKKKLEKYLNQLIINPNHWSHQRLVKHLQDDLKYPSSVQYIRKALESNFDYLQYTYSDDGVIAKWFSHALHSIGTKEAIELMKEYSKSANHQIKDEMRYRLLGFHIEKIVCSLPKLDLEHYEESKQNLPKKGKYFFGHERNGLITFYAAFNKRIVADAIKNQKFGSGFSFNRMTWVKPSFMWMMHRSGWATKENQENILAIKIKKSDVLKIMNEAVLSNFSDSEYRNEEEWKLKMAESNVRIQWDPDHDKSGNKLDRKAIQVGLKGETLEKFNSEYVQEIEDITEFVEAQRVHKEIYKCKHFLVPKEKVIDFGNDYYIVGQERSIFEKIKQRIKKKNGM